MFPEILSRWQRFTDRNRPVSLGLRSVTFAPKDLDSEFLRKYPEIYRALGSGGPTWSGVNVTRESALQHPVVWACDQLVSGVIGYLPATVMQRKPDGTRREATELPMYDAMKFEVNAEMTSQGFRELLTSHCLFTGGGYAQIIRRSGTGTALELRQLTPEQVEVGREEKGQRRLKYTISQKGNSDKTYFVESGKPQDILHLRGHGWDGAAGYSVLDKARQSIGAALAADKNVALFWASGGRLPYLLKMQKFKNDPDYEKFRADWERIYSQPWRAPILEPGMEYESIGTSMRDAQSSETRQAQVAEICRWFDVLPNLVGDLSRATFNNMEQYVLLFEKITLSKWLQRWNAEFHRCVLTPEEKAKGYYIKHNLDALRRGEFKERMEAYASALQNGWKSVDEVRSLEDDDPLPGGAGSHYHIQTNMGLLTRDGVVVAAKPQPQLGGPNGSAQPGA